MASHCKHKGFSYIEVLVAVAIVAVALVPMLEALRSGLLASEAHEQLTLIQQRVFSRMEEMLAEPFGALDAAALAAGSETTPTSYSDPVATPNRRLVYLSRYDGDNADSDDLPFTGIDAGLIWVRVEIENTVHGLDALTAL